MKKVKIPYTCVRAYYFTDEKRNVMFWLIMAALSAVFAGLRSSGVQYS